MNTSDSTRYTKAIALINEANQQDPNTEVSDGSEAPKELLYSQRMLDMLSRYLPEADEVAKLSAAAQHIERWKSPRSDYSMDRKGYHQWRTGLYTFHADTAGVLLQKVGYDAETIKRVKAAIAKKDLRNNPDTQIVEDLAALTFIEHYMLAMYEKFPQYDEEKWIDIILRTWNKMSPAAQAFALSGKVSLPESLVAVIKKAIA